MKKENHKIQRRIRQRPKRSMRILLLFGVFSIGVILLMTTIFNFSGMNILKANEHRPIEVRQVDEQEFYNEMSIPTPYLNHQKTAGPNTVFIRKIIPKTDQTLTKHE